jgi:hypothetical protein
MEKLFVKILKNVLSVVHALALAQMKLLSIVPASLFLDLLLIENFKYQFCITC